MTTHDDGSGGMDMVGRTPGTARPVGRVELGLWAMALCLAIAICLWGVAIPATSLANRRFHHEESCTVTSARLRQVGVPKGGTSRDVVVETSDCGRLTLRSAGTAGESLDSLASRLEAGVGRRGRFVVGDLQVVWWQSSALRFDGWVS